MILAADEEFYFQTGQFLFQEKRCILDLNCSFWGSQTGLSLLDERGPQSDKMTFSLHETNQQNS